MNCPACGYLMSETDLVCPRCHGKGPAGVGSPTGLPSGPSPAPQPDDSPSFFMALVGFCIPLAGLIIFLIERDRKPLQARSAIRGAGLGTLMGSVVVPLIIMLITNSLVKQFFSSIDEPAVNAIEDEMPDNVAREECRRNLKQLAQAALAYSKAHNGKLPNLSSSAAIRESLNAYVEHEEIFTCPGSGQEYLGNLDLSGKQRSKIRNAATTPLFLEANNQAAHDQNSHPGGYVVYLNGSVKFRKQP